MKKYWYFTYYIDNHLEGRVVVSEGKFFPVGTIMVFLKKENKKSPLKKIFGVSFWAEISQEEYSLFETTKYS